MKTIVLVIFCLSAWTTGVQAQSLGISIRQPQFDGVVIVSGPTAPPPIIFNQPVVCNAPVEYNAPVVYNAPVIDNSAPPAIVCLPPPCVRQEVACNPPSNVQVISFGGVQACREGYQFDAPR